MSVLWDALGLGGLLRVPAALELEGAAARIRDRVVARWRVAYPGRSETDAEIWDAHRTQPLTCERFAKALGGAIDAIDALEARIKALEERSEPWKSSGDGWEPGSGLA